MNTEMESAKLEVVLEATSVNASVPDTTINVTVGDGAKIEVGEAITYIKSGQAEIDEAVAEGKTEITAHTNTKIGEFNANAVEKTNAFNQNATDKTTAFNTNYAEKKALIDEQVGIATTQAGIATAKAAEASQSATSASQSATSAETYAGQAESSASEASTSATNAYASEVNAGQSASDASDSATSASNSASTATTQAGIATTKAGEASTSATNAANSASSASSSASTATTQAGIATTKASEASTSASNASLSEQNASSYADSASQSALDAATSETNASQSASNASQSASTATNQASIATSKAAEASSSATSASNSASSASSSATTATNQANLAKQYAIGEPTEPTEHSAKYWAEQAESELSGLSSRVTTIEGKIPSSASSSNQLTDKDYVDTQDNALQSQIDALVVASDVFDIVGTYAELQAYDISTVPVNDIIKVLVDSTHSGAATYYRCVESGGVKSWSYIGSEGAYYTKAETNSLLDDKQDTLVSGTNIKTLNNESLLGSGNININSATWGNITGTLSNQTDLQNALDGKQDFISDLSTIRSGAELGATSIQPNDNVSELTNDAGYITGITSSDVTTALGYTPYNSTNPAGYTSNVGTVTSVNNTQPDANGNVTISTGGNYTAGTGIDITNDVISVASPTLTNTATGSGNLVVGGSQPVSTGNTSFGFYSSTSVEGTSFGYGATSSGHCGVAIGWGSNATANHSTALGTKSTSSGMFAIQIGRGTNSTDYSLSIGFDTTGNYQLLDGTTGLIPDARISSNIARTSSIPTATSDLTNDSGFITSSDLPTVDQTYSSISTNAQSGVAVAQALSSVSVSKDNLSITENANNQLQTVGVIDQNDTTQAIKTWTGTLAEYNAIVTKDPDTLYNITDDTDFTLTLLETLYPVGSIYITTASTCPLSTLISGSTWELVSSGRVLQGADSGHSAGTTVEAGLPNIEGFTDWWSYGNGTSYNQMGAFFNAASPLTGHTINTTAGGTANYAQLISFSAQNSNPIYGNSTTVQPPAYFVNIYRRTA